MRKIEFCCICSKPLFRAPVRHLADGRAIGPDCLLVLNSQEEEEPPEADEEESEPEEEPSE